MLQQKHCLMMVLPLTYLCGDSRQTVDILRKRKSFSTVENLLSTHQATYITSRMNYRYLTYLPVNRSGVMV